MTMPHLMNCAHLDDGWCLDCVRQLGEGTLNFISTAEREVFREWEEVNYPMGPGWNTHTRILLWQAWASSARTERERSAKVCERMALRHDDIRRAALEVAAESIRQP